MKHFLRKGIIHEIRNGNEAILTQLSQKYFPSIRKLLRIRGFRDSETPEVFSKILASVYLNISKEKTSVERDFEKYLLNSTNEYIRKIKDDNSRKSGAGSWNTEPNSLPSTPYLNLTTPYSTNKVIADCVSILDEQLQRLLYSRVVEKLSYELIAERFKFSNAVIAQYEIDKAFQQLEGIVKIRTNYE